MATIQSGMLLPGDDYPAITVDKLVTWIIKAAKGDHDYIKMKIIDVNPREIYQKQRIIDAEHYEKNLLCRDRYETDTLRRCKNEEGMTIVIYGEGSCTSVAVLSERGYNAVLLKGNVEFFREQYPKGLIFPPCVSYDIVALEKRVEFKSDAKYGRRLWRSTSASRTRADNTRKQRQASAGNKTRIPWK